MPAREAIATAAVILHTLSAVVWVGGMFFAYLVLRSATLRLETEARLRLWAHTFARFFGWVFAAIGLAIQLMQGFGIVMMLLFLHLYFAPWRRFRAAVARQDWAEGARQLAQIRRIVAINLTLGAITVALGSSGRYWS